MLALLLLLPTLAFVPIYFFIFPPIYIVLRSKFQEGQNILTFNYRKISINFLIVLLIIVTSLVNKIIYYYDELPLLSLIPYTIAIPLTYFIAKFLRRKDFEALIVLVGIEAIIVFVQYFTGVNTFFETLDLTGELSSEKMEMLYYSRPFGLSMNSSIIAYKLLLGYLLLDYLKLKNIFYTLIRLLFIVAIYLTFNRTVFLAMIVYFGFSAVKLYGPVIENLLERKIQRFQVKYLFIASVGIVCLAIIVFMYGETIMNQLTRGRTDKVDLSGRDHIWAQFLSFIKSNWAFGNGSQKFYVPHGDNMAHAHNSFLQIIATHGIFIFSLYAWLILRNINGRNALFVLVLVVYSLFQYGMFWGISLLDIILFKFLFFENSRADFSRDEVINNS